MSKFRIKGLVRVATGVRQEMARPLSSQRAKSLRRRVADSLGRVDEILARNGRAVGDLPPQSRRAYEFLAGLDLDSLAIDDAPESDARRSVGTVYFPGMRRRLEGWLDALARRDPKARESAAWMIEQFSEHIETEIARAGDAPERLTAETRTIRGWVAFFAQADNLSDYLAAVSRASREFERALQRTNRYKLPPLIWLRPCAAIYRMRGHTNCTRVTLPTPMIVFEESAFESLALLATRQIDTKQAVIERMAEDDYQGLRLELESLGGVVEQTAGAFHDLARSFERVNKIYFNGGMARPRLTWTRSFNSRKFGHYEHLRDTVMVSSSLDGASVSESVVDFIVFHELLHKKLGLDWRNGRKRSHTPEFKRQERRFRRFEEMESALKTIASGKTAD